MLISLVVPLSLARDVVHEPRAARPPEAFYLLSTATQCWAAIEVDAAGRPRKAMARSCSRVLAPAIVEQAMRFRFEPGPQSVEEVLVTVKPPQFTPRGRKPACIVAFDVLGDELYELGVSRCGVTAAPLESPPPPPRPFQRHWCAVDVTPTADGVTVARADCTEAYRDLVVREVQRWTWDDAQPVRVLLRFDGAVMNGLTAVRRTL